MYKKETAALNAQISKARAKVEECQSKRDVLVAGSELDGLGAFDLAIQKFMRGIRIRAGQLTILKDGFPLMQHAYTYQLNDPSYPKTKPGSLFRIASCSKPFTCACIQSLYDDGLLKPTDRICPLLQITKPVVGAKDLGRPVGSRGEVCSWFSSLRGPARTAGREGGLRQGGFQTRRGRR